MSVSDRLLRPRAINEANDFVAAYGAFGDAEMMRRLASRVEAVEYRDAPLLRQLVAEELRTRAKLVRPPA